MAYLSIFAAKELNLLIPLWSMKKKIQIFKCFDNNHVKMTSEVNDLHGNTKTKDDF